MGWKGGTGRMCCLVSALVVLRLSAELASQKPNLGTGEINLAATSANVAGPGNPVTVRIFRWSTDQERTPLMAALDPPPAPPPSAAGRGATGRGGPAGGGRGRGAAPAAPVSPTEALAAAIAKAPSIGYIWTSDVTGYAIKYAFRASLPDGGERIILATDRRLGAYTAAWQPVVSTPLTDYGFTVIEMRLDAKGSGEAKTSLTTRVVVDKEAGTVALENYAATPAILQKVGPGARGR